MTPNDREYPSAAGLAFTGAWEGWMPRWYKDIGGVWTRGFGHAKTATDIVDIHAPPLSQEQGYSLLRRDMARCVAPIVALSQEIDAAWNQSWIDALADFCFNCGPGAIGTVEKPSGVLAAIIAGKPEDVPAALALWCKVVIDGQKVTNEGLLHRRMNEGALFLTTDPQVPTVPHDRGLAIAIPDEEIERRGEVVLRDLTWQAIGDDRAADLERRNREAGF